MRNFEPGWGKLVSVWKLEVRVARLRTQEHSPQNIPRNECCCCEQPIGKQKNFLLPFDWMLTTSTFVPWILCGLGGVTLKMTTYNRGGFPSLQPVMPSIWHLPMLPPSSACSPRKTLYGSRRRPSTVIQMIHPADAAAGDGGKGRQASLFLIVFTLILNVIDSWSMRWSTNSDLSWPWSGCWDRHIGLRADPEPLQVPAEEALQTGKGSNMWSHMRHT